jgi:hypothetical protein
LEKELEEDKNQKKDYIINNNFKNKTQLYIKDEIVICNFLLILPSLKFNKLSSMRKCNT